MKKLYLFTLRGLYLQHIVRYSTLAKDVLMKCLQVTDFQHGMKEFTGKLNESVYEMFCRFVCEIFYRFVS